MGSLPLVTPRKLLIELGNKINGKDEKWGGLKGIFENSSQCYAQCRKRRGHGCGWEIISLELKWA